MRGFRVCAGERIRLTPSIRLLFEVSDLAAASPATVSRCGMLFVSPQALNWKVIMQAYLARYTPAAAAAARASAAAAARAGAAAAARAAGAAAAALGCSAAFDAPDAGAAGSDDGAAAVAAAVVAAAAVVPAAAITIEESTRQKCATVNPKP